MLLRYTLGPLTIGRKHGSMLLNLAMFSWPSHTAVIDTPATHRQLAAPAPLSDLAHVTLNGDLKVLMSMEQHRKLPMNGDFFPLRNLNE